VAGVASSSGAPVKAILATEELPFVGIAKADGAYILPAATGSVSVAARVPSTSLTGTAVASVEPGATTSLDLSLTGTITAATVRPADATTGVPVNAQVSIETTAGLNPSTATAENVQLYAGTPADGLAVPVRLVLSGSGRTLAVIPEQNLAYSATYTLVASGLADVFGGLVSVAQTSFTTEDEVAPFYDPKTLSFSFPDANGIVKVTAPGCWPDPGCFMPGTEILLINSGNGVVLTLTAENDGAVGSLVPAEMPASLSDRILVTITDPLGNTVSFAKSEFVDPETGRVGVGPGGATVEAADGSGMELRIPEGAVQGGVSLKLEGLGPEAFPED
jgi:Bacterial Ig-like domain